MLAGQIADAILPGGPHDRFVKKFSAILLLAGALVLTAVPAPLFAQEAEHKAAESGKPKTEEKPGMEIWKWANFAFWPVFSVI